MIRQATLPDVSVQKSKGKGRGKGKGDNAWKSKESTVNYCDHGLFNADRLASLNLVRTSGYFIGSTTCTADFFQCSHDRTYTMKCSGVQARLTLMELI